MPSTTNDLKSTIQSLLSDENVLSKASLPGFFSRAGSIAQALGHEAPIDNVPLSQLKPLLLADVDSLRDEKIIAALERTRALLATNEKGEEFVLPEGVHRNDRCGVRYWYHDSSVILENGAWELFDSHGTRIGYPDKRYYNSKMRVTDLRLAIEGLIEFSKQENATSVELAKEERQFERELNPRRGLARSYGRS